MPEKQFEFPKTPYGIQAKICFGLQHPSDRFVWFQNRLFLKRYGRWSEMATGNMSSGPSFYRVSEETAQELEKQERIKI